MTASGGSFPKENKLS